MSQNDLSIANQGFASFRSDLNSALQALGSTNSGTSAPSTTYANQLFYDTTNNILKIRNEDNDAFISLFTLDQANDNIEALTIDGTLTYNGDLVSSTAGISNFRAGVNAGNSIASGGNYNVALGDEAGTAINTGDNNTVVGYQAGDAITTGGGNVAIGSGALSSIDTDSNSTAVGYNALNALNIEGNSNVAVGLNALKLNVSGGNNTAIGTNALAAQNTSGSATDTNNTALGNSAGASVTSGVSNTLIGANTGDALTGGLQNTAIGQEALGADVNGRQSVAIGFNALTSQNFSSAGDANNTAVGYKAGEDITTGVQNVLVGQGAGLQLTDADINVAIGNNALTTDTLGSRSVAIGYEALQNQNFTSATNSYNTAVGGQAGKQVTTGYSNTFIGGRAGDAVTDGFENTFVGQSAGTAVTTGDRNLFVGNNAGELATTGNNNTFVGANGTAGSCGGAMTTGSKNTILGGYTGNQNGIDIRTSDSYVVISDGDGNHRMIVGSSGEIGFGKHGSKSNINNTILFTATGNGTHNDHFWSFGPHHTSDTPSFYTINEAGTGVVLSHGNTSWSTHSDERIKENITSLENVLPDIKSVRCVKYNLKGQSDTKIGFIAQDWESKFSEVVQENKEQVIETDGSVSMAENSKSTTAVKIMQYTETIPILLKAIQELEARIATLESK